jgi:2-iminobutanoate/2-iminopropanoate deaminase
MVSVSRCPAPEHAATGKLIEGDITARTERVLLNLSAVLAQAGSGMDRVVKTTVSLKNLSGFPAMNDVYAKFFANVPPARSTVQVAGLPKDALLEIDVVDLQYCGSIATGYFRASQDRVRFAAKRTS